MQKQYTSVQRAAMRDVFQAVLEYRKSVGPVVDDHVCADITMLADHESFTQAAAKDAKCFIYNAIMPYYDVNSWLWSHVPEYKLMPTEQRWQEEFAYVNRWLEYLAS
jgi:hypothetical protein